ncbi:uncharacterized protein [Battus philenor]|uniref:uncharacterized protein n=1 Tax=Battus philenor TaxID=42288 RepID=UPI0035CFF66E
MIVISESERPMNIPVLISEVLFLGVVTTIFNRYSVLKTRDRIDSLLQESKYGLRLMNIFLDEWHQRRVHNNEYLDEEPQPLAPLKLEVPILHMAIIDTRGSTTRGQLERGDAGDSVNISDSTLLTVTSIIDEDFESILSAVNEDQMTDEIRNIDNNRYLWNVLEEDDDDLRE